MYAHWRLLGIRCQWYNECAMVISSNRSVFWIWKMLLIGRNAIIFILSWLLWPKWDLIINLSGGSSCIFRLLPFSLTNNWSYILLLYLCVLIIIIVSSKKKITIGSVRPMQPASLKFKTSFSSQLCRHFY